jgi:hypothetical protein
MASRNLTLSHRVWFYLSSCTTVVVTFEFYSLRVFFYYFRPNNNYSELWQCMEQNFFESSDSAWSRIFLKALTVHGAEFFLKALTVHGAEFFLKLWQCMEQNFFWKLWVLGFFSSRPKCDPHPLTRRRVWPPLGSGGTHSLGGEGMGEGSQLGRGDRHCGTLGTVYM